MIDDLLRQPAIHAPTVGILLCTDKNEKVVRYALRAAAAPMAIATYTYDKLPADERAALPGVDVLATAIAEVPPPDENYGQPEIWEVPTGEGDGMAAPS